MDADPKDIVRVGYDCVSYAYRADQEDAGCAEYHGWLDELIPLVAPGSPILELGCGCGIPVARRLSQHYPVTGIDLSPVQIKRARRLVPQASFMCADMTQVDFAQPSFVAVIAFYAIIHVPLDEQPALLNRIRCWLRPAGHLMITVGNERWTGIEEDWLGVPGGRMYWNHADSETYRQWLCNAGFNILWSRFIPENDGGHMLFLAQAEGT